MYGSVSVIIPAYNAEKTIGRAIQSVLSQTYDKLEVIVIDDCSKDGTAEVVKQISKTDERVKLFTNAQNSGVAKSRNNGVIKASSELVAFLDSDDRWTADKLEKQLVAISNHPQCAVCFTATAYTDEDGKMSDYVLRVPEKVTYNDILTQNVISCSSVLVKKEVMLENPMPDRRDIHEDLATWLSILKKTPYAVGVDFPHLIYTVSPKSKSGNKIKAAKMQILTYKYCEVPFFKAVKSFCFYALKNVKKYKSLKIGD